MTQTDNQGEMSTMNDNVADFLNLYITEPDPQYAIMLTGRWGCGKTFFINKWLENYKNNKKDTKLEPIYVSLYGLSHLSEIKRALDREMYPFFYSKFWQRLVKAWKLFWKFAFKTDLNLDDCDKNGEFKTSTIDSFDILGKQHKKIKGKLLVFDDIERTSVDIKPLLGFINSFVEHCHCHVIILGDDSKIGGAKKREFDEFREKTIGHVFEISPDINDALNDFLERIPSRDFFDDYKPLITECFLATKYNNLRILKRALYDFGRIIQRAKIGASDYKHPILENFLCSFISVNEEHGIIEMRKLLTKWNQRYALNLGLDKKETKDVQDLIDKYQRISQQCLQEVLYPTYVKWIVNYIDKGEDFCEYLSSAIKEYSKEPEPWEKLENFLEMSNGDFDENYWPSIKALSEGTIENWNQIGKTLGFIAHFDKVGIQKCDDNDIGKIKNAIGHTLSKVKDKNQLYQIRGAFATGLQYVIGRDDNTTVIQPVIDEFKKVFNSQDESLEDTMTHALYCLSDDNVEQLTQIDDKTIPNGNSSYQLVSIFENIEPERLWDNIQKLSNKGKKSFCQFLSSHYKFGMSIQGIDNRFEKDKPVLQEIKQHVEQEIKSSKQVERYSYQNMLAYLERAIRRAEGKVVV